MSYNEDLAKRIRLHLKSTSSLTEKKMFGGIGFLINGNMACGVNKQDLIVRLGEADFEKALKQAHVRIFDMTGKPMKGWILISSGGYSSEKSLRSWLDRGVAFARSLPAK
jgi:TfoX/Sxy family transcriptional regulator of competence genes